jgi:hypothetical protein
MLICAAILFTCYKWWDREADEALEQVKNFLQETK